MVANTGCFRHLRADIHSQNNLTGVPLPSYKDTYKSVCWKMICPQFINTFYIVMQYILYMCTYIQQYFYVSQCVQFHVIHSNFKILFYFFFFFKWWSQTWTVSQPTISQIRKPRQRLRRLLRIAGVGGGGAQSHWVFREIKWKDLYQLYSNS